MRQRALFIGSMGAGIGLAYVVVRGLSLFDLPEFVIAAGVATVVTCLVLPTKEVVDDE